MCKRARLELDPHRWQVPCLAAQLLHCSCCMRCNVGRFESVQLLVGNALVIGRVFARHALLVD